MLRHAVQRLAVQRGVQGWVVLLSDGSPHDNDVHDPGYLIKDARHAVVSAARLGVRICCLVFEPDGSGDAALIFGRRGAVRVHGLNDLPGALGSLRRSPFTLSLSKGLFAQGFDKLSPTGGGLS